MSEIQQLDRIAISVKSHRLLNRLLKENPKLEEILRNSRNETEALIGVRDWVLEDLTERPEPFNYYRNASTGHAAFEKLEWSD